MHCRIINDLIHNLSFARILMNIEAGQHALKGRVLDVGGGKPERAKKFYKLFASDESVSIELIDINQSNGCYAVNLEEDLFPFPDSSFNQALIFNVFEHIYNYKFLTNEIFRVLGIGGQALGFVPFLVNVHPDPHDYFRYTEESLGKIFREAGFDQIDIKIIGRGPFAVHFNNIIFSIPKYLRPIFFIFYNFLDIIYIHLGHGVKERFPLGYFFNLQKK